ncbi:MAG TPA: hypothetical protein VII38_07515, partial [Polyangia bacterium]
MRRLAWLALVALLPACTLLIGDRRHSSTDGGVDLAIGSDGGPSLDGGARDLSGMGTIDGAMPMPGCTMVKMVALETVDIGSADAVAVASIGGGEFVASFIVPGSSGTPTLHAVVFDTNGAITAKNDSLYAAAGPLSTPRVARGLSSEPIDLSVVSGSQLIRIGGNRTLTGSSPPQMSACPNGATLDDLAQSGGTSFPTVAAVCGGGNSPTYDDPSGNVIATASELRLARDPDGDTFFAYLTGSDFYTGGFSVSSYALGPAGKLFPLAGGAGLAFDVFHGGASMPPHLLAAAETADHRLTGGVGGPGMSSSSTTSGGPVDPANGRFPLGVAAWERGFFVAYSQTSGASSNAILQLVDPMGTPVGGQNQIAGS